MRSLKKDKKIYDGEKVPSCNFWSNKISLSLYADTGGGVAVIVDVFLLGEEVVAALALAAFSAHSLLVGSWERPSPARLVDIGIGGEGERNPSSPIHLSIHPSRRCYLGRLGSISLSHRPIRQWGMV